MATTKPRITVTLTERQHEVLRTISDCGGQPMSRFISELLELSLRRWNAWRRHSEDQARA